MQAVGSWPEQRAYKKKMADSQTGTKQLTEADRIRIRALAFDAGYTRSQIRDRTGASVAQVKLALKCQTPVPRSGRPPKDPSNPKRRKRGPRSVPTPALKPPRFERGPGVSAAEAMAVWAAAEAARSGEAAEEAAMPEEFHLLVLNPNSSAEMTEGVRKAIESSITPHGNNAISYYTAPEPSPASINDGLGLARSTEVVLADLQAKAAARDADDAEADGDAAGDAGAGSSSDNHDELDGYDGVLVACYSVHPLVAHLAERHRGRRVVLGILEASVLAALALTNPYPRCPESPGRTWGIVTTGAFWEAHLEDGVRRFLDASYSASFSPGPGQNAAKFAGVYTTGLDAGDFHGDVGPEVVRAKLKDATKRLLAFGRVGCVVMGCAGMAGLEDVIRSAIAEEYGEPQTPQEKVYIIDGVKAGVGLLAETIRNERMFSQ
ncbi:hypothetical protein RB595_004992 [Gaeumannomyces hyphopodioides]